MKNTKTNVTLEIVSLILKSKHNGEYEETSGSCKNSMEDWKFFIGEIKI